ncbi:MAG: tetratricopeptide repeat protein [Candidatus Accumulibacter sp. UW26]|jgi:tetratricopeptide (TPR) repeat protein
MIDTLFGLFGTFYQRGNLLQAEQLARSILQAVPDDLVSLQFLGLLYYRTRRHEQAVEAFDAAAGSREASAEGCVDHSLRASRECVRAAHRQGSVLARVWYDLGVVLFRLRRYPQAMDALQSALRGQPDFSAAMRAIARIAAVSSRQRTLVPRHASAAGRCICGRHPAGRATEHSPGHCKDRPLADAQCRQKMHRLSEPVDGHAIIVSECRVVTDSEPVFWRA